MPRKITVAAAQLGPASPHKQENVARIEALLDKAIQAGVQIMNFPELALTTYFPKHAPPASRSKRDRFFDTLPSVLIEKLLIKARENGVSVIVPYGEKAGDEYFNSALVVDGRGKVLGTYRKVHTPEPLEWAPGKLNAYESTWFRGGNLGFPVFDVGVATIGVLICYDRHLPEAARCLALEGAEIIFLCTNSPTYGSSHSAWRAETHDMILRTRAYENTVFVVSAEKGGVEEGMGFLGRSAIVSPTAEILAMAGQNENDELVWAAIDVDAIAEARKTRRFLAERRPCHYGRIMK